jgi:large subunit ribosomal protein L28
MSRRCELTGKESLYGHKVSHAKNRTNRRFVPNLQKVTLHSDALRKDVKLRVCTRALRSVQRNSGLDSYLLSRADAKLAPIGLKLKHQIQKVLSAPKKATKAA